MRRFDQAFRCVLEQNFAGVVEEPFPRRAVRERASRVRPRVETRWLTARSGAKKLLRRRGRIDARGRRATKELRAEKESSIP